MSWPTNLISAFQEWPQYHVTHTSMLTDQKDALSYSSETKHSETTNSSATPIGTEVFMQQHAWRVADQEQRLLELGQACSKMVDPGSKRKQLKFYTPKSKSKKHLRIAKTWSLVLATPVQFSLWRQMLWMQSLSVPSCRNSLNGPRQCFRDQPAFTLPLPMPIVKIILVLSHLSKKEFKLWKLILLLISITILQSMDLQGLFQTKVYFANSHANIKLLCLILYQRKKMRRNSEKE